MDAETLKTLRDKVTRAEELTRQIEFLRERIRLIHDSKGYATHLSPSGTMWRLTDRPSNAGWQLDDIPVELIKEIHEAVRTRLVLHYRAQLNKLESEFESL